MATAKTPKMPTTPPPVPYQPRKTVILGFKPTDSIDVKGRALAEAMTSPELAAFKVITATEKGNWGDDIDTPTLLQHLRDSAKTVINGNLAHCEAMLMNQAFALQALFTKLAMRGMGQNLTEHFDADMKIALRAQSQCRATLETLAAIKNPPVVYARQANVTSGPQQIVNGIPAPSQARKIETGQSKPFSGDGHGLVTGIQSEAIASNPAMAAVGAVNRPEDSRVRPG
ncbi:conserved hypothetical protein [Gammaproteobacteria bacterium]